MTHGLEFPAPADELVQPTGAACPMSCIEMARRRQFTAEYRLRILEVHISHRAAWTELRDGKNP